MPNTELLKYIENARSQKIPDQQIKAQLLKFGWSESDTLEALTPQNTNITLPPPPIPQFGMWVSFQYILLFISLYVSFTSFGGILHHVVDRYIKDNLDRVPNISYEYYDNWLLQSYIAGILVTYPIFATLFLILKRQLLNKPAVRNLRARKILIYLTLVSTFLIMICQLIFTIYGFLGGNATLRTLAHLGVTLFVAGSVFIYLLHEVREDRKTE